MYSYLSELSDTYENEEDEHLIQEIERLYKKVQKKKVLCMFSSILDEKDAFIEIHPGAGGKDSSDWAEMLFRMYNRWCTVYHNYDVTVIDMSFDETGIKSVILKVVGKQAYGWLKKESGIHRLVRISPFNANAKRHTSFASVVITPCISEDIQINISDSDIKIDTYRASGAGGQHVNKTDSAVRITHIPSKIVVQCQNSRSQHRNKNEAMLLLKSKLYEQEMKKKKSEQKVEKKDISWGNQIRSYIMHPYQMVKDIRTNISLGNIDKVLDGDIDEFLIAALLK